MSLGRWLRYSIAVLMLPLTLTSALVPASGLSISQDAYTLIFHEEFDGPEINESIWNFNIGDGCPNLCGWGNAELEYYRRENAFIENGTLIIEARKEHFMDPATGKRYNYTSARLDTIGKLRVEPPFRVEVRAKLPAGKGIWPAIWMLGEEWSLQNARAWPACGEIDIVELIGSEPDTIYGTVHAPFCYGGRGVGSSFRLPKGEGFSEDFHVFGVEVTSDYIVWFVDDQVYHLVTRAEFTQRGCEWVFDKAFHLILNVAVGGYWPGYPDQTTVFPARMVVDWIRIFRVNKPTYDFLVEKRDVDDEVIVRFRGFPSVTAEEVVNGGFEHLPDPNNSPVMNPDEWYFVGRLDVLDLSSLSVDEGALRLTIKPPGPGQSELRLGQLVWVRQNASYTVWMRAWSDKSTKAVLRVSTPVYPAKVISEAVAELTNAPKTFTLTFDNPVGGPNVVEVAVVFTEAIDETTTLYIDEIGICPAGSCSPMEEESTTIPPIHEGTETTTSPTETSTTSTTSSEAEETKTEPKGTASHIQEIKTGVLVASIIALIGTLAYLLKHRGSGGE